MVQTLNSPLEVGLRAVVLLAETYPEPSDIDRLVLMDHFLLHSGDFGGPASIQPALSTRGTELSAKRAVMAPALQLMVRTNLLNQSLSARGFLFQASDRASPFLQLVRTTHLLRLTKVASWVAEQLSPLSADDIRGKLHLITSQWAELDEVAELSPNEFINEIAEEYSL